MSSKMLIDAAHPEETRVVVLKGNRVEEFDFESASKRQLRGNIYLAKVTRVEPSLQAAFVDYGGNRHGFLAFSEIHPDYYQIPHADRQALLEEEARAHRDEEDDARSNGHRRSRRHRRDNAVSAMDRRGGTDPSVSEPAFAEAARDEASLPSWTEGPVGFDGETDEAAESEREFTTENTGSSVGESFGTHTGHSPATDPTEPTSHRSDDYPGAADAEMVDADTTAVASEHAASPDRAEPEARGTEVLPNAAASAPESMTAGSSEAEALGSPDAAAAMIEGGADALLDPSPETEPGNDGEADEHGPEDAEEEMVEQVGGDEFEETAHRAPRPRRHYKIQEVIKRRQILLVQVVKEERGNKGAALTTYLSLAGRYSVLMPNTARGGGISRKITDAEDRKRLKAIAQDLEVPEGMGVILRTAGAARGKVEVNRDFEYLLRMWESVRELTLKSTAPSLVYEEGSLIKRSIRDLYTRDVEEVIVAGEEGYREAKEFMRMLMPSAAKNVHLYRDSQPIFAKTGAEAQLDAMFSNHVTLKSGGYLVINQTEALVAIDVNSGRSTREHNIEDTALRTNLEAADEIARQLRLRDLAGLIVVDFIDMEEGRNNRAVERRIKEALKNDRARIQIGRISHFGLLEMSRQRIRTGVLEGSTVICPHCAGSGTVRSTASIALHVLRLLEDALIKDASHNLVVRTRSEVALYILNQKRSTLNDLEARFGVSLTIAVDPSLTGMIYHAIERGEPAAPAQPQLPRGDRVRVDSLPPLYEDDEDSSAGDEFEETDGGENLEAGGDGETVTGDRDFAQEGNGEGRRRKRRRRRRGRDRDAPAGTIGTEASQPSDEGLARMARIEGDFVAAQDEPDDFANAPDASSDGEMRATDQDAEPGYAAHAGEVAEPTRRRRSRRGAARPEEETAVEPAAAEDRDPASSGEDGRVDEAGPAPKRRRPGRARAMAAASLAADAASADSQMPVQGDRDAQHAPASAQMEAAPAVGESGAAPTAPDQPPAASAEDGATADSAAIPGSEPASATEPAEPAAAIEPGSAVELDSAGEAEPPRPKRTGWWQRAKATFGS